jgi:cobalamin biosynthesis Co2+ chelatase CbiK
MSDAKIETMVMITGREYEALRAENEKLRAALKKINVGDDWAALIARAALEEKQ